MSKSVLVIDTPKCCIECPMCFQSDEMSIGAFEYRKLYSCRYAPSDVEDFYLPDILHGKPKWCPLKEAPQKKPDKATGEWFNFIMATMCALIDFKRFE